jgi:hypothetical protein
VRISGHIFTVVVTGVFTVFALSQLRLQLLRRHSHALQTALVIALAVVFLSSGVRS